MQDLGPPVDKVEQIGVGQPAVSEKVQYLPLAPLRGHMLSREGFCRVPPAAEI